MIVGTLVLGVAGRVLGIFELFVLAAGAGGLVLVAAVAVLARAVDLDATRTVRPTRVHAGGDSRVELAVRNRAGRRSPVVTVRDTLAPAAANGAQYGPTPDTPAGTRAGAPRQARLLLAPLDPGAEDRATYRLPAGRRGVFRVGPLSAELTDAFGLWSRSTTIAPPIELTVYPAVEVLAPLAHSRGDDPTAGAPRPAALGASGEDLYGLRPYRMGDDLRRVHWPSTARTGDLMVRQLEVPWQGRATVLLDVRAAVHTDASLEAAVSAAASIVTASWTGGSLARLATTEGTDSGFAAGHAHFEAVMEHLAVVGTGDDALEPVVAALHRAGNGGALAVVTTDAAPAPDLELLAGLRTRFDSLTIVVVGGAGGRKGQAGPPAPDAVRRAGGTTVVRVPAGSTLAGAWHHLSGGGTVRPERRVP